MVSLIMHLMVERNRKIGLAQSYCGFSCWPMKFGMVAPVKIVSCTYQSKYNAFVHVEKYSGLLPDL